MPPHATTLTGGDAIELTARERRVLGLIAGGLSNAAICRELHLSSSGLENHITATYRKLGLNEIHGGNRRVLAVRYYLGVATTKRPTERVRTKDA